MSGDSEKVVFYGLIAKGTLVLAEHTLEGYHGNFAELTASVLEKVPANDQLIFYAHESYYFHLLMDDGLSYLCVSEQSMGKVIPSKFLKKLRDAFVQQFGDRASASGLKPLAFNADFKKTLRTLMLETTVASSGDQKVNAVKSELAQAKQIMEKNIDKAIDRGERLDILVDKTENVRSKAVQFHRGAKDVRRQFCCKNAKTTLVFLLLILAVIFFIVMFACGGITFSHCKAKAS